MFDITDKRLVQLEKIYRTYQDSLDLGIPPQARYAVTWFLSSFLIGALAAHIATMADVHSIMVPMFPFFCAAVVAICKYVSFPHRSWFDYLNTLLSAYRPASEQAFVKFEAQVTKHGFMAEDVIDWVCAERTALANAEHAARARAIVERIAND